MRTGERPAREMGIRKDEDWINKKDGKINKPPRKKRGIIYSIIFLCDII